MCVFLFEYFVLSCWTKASSTQTSIIVTTFMEKGARELSFGFETFTKLSLLLPRDVRKLGVC